MNNIQLYHGDCLVEMQRIPDGSVDMILCDLPYEVLNKGNSNASWDRKIPFDKLWEQYNRIIKDNGAIVLFSQGMFTAELMMSNPTMWRYNLIWQKDRVTGFLNANRMPMRSHEDILVFYKSLPTYNPQMSPGSPNHARGTGFHQRKNNCYGVIAKEAETTISNEKFPRSIISINKEHKSVTYHPTQKPVSLLEWLIKTYTNEGETVLDNTMGSGSTGVACINTKRHFIGIEKDDHYFDVAQKRIKQSSLQLTLF